MTDLDQIRADVERARANLTAMSGTQQVKRLRSAELTLTIKIATAMPISRLVTRNLKFCRLPLAASIF